MSDDLRAALEALCDEYERFVGPAAVAPVAAFRALLTEHPPTGDTQ